jgi:alkylation response protein AidB-like acyl-CoA dehydrogenase
MNETLREQQRMVSRSAAGFTAAHGGPARARQVSDGAPAWEPQSWKAMAELGWLAIAAPESAGGLDLGAGTLCLVAQECGRALLTLPLTGGWMAAAALADASHAEAAKALGRLLAGDAHIACADAPDDHRPPRDALVSLVPDGGTASQWLVARGQGGGFELRLLRMDAPGVRVSARPAVDGSPLADAAVAHAAWSQAPLVLQGEDGQSSWRRARCLAWLGDAAYLSGLAESALNLAVEYLRVRRQFGVPIGSFQALQHRAADCHVDVTASRALAHEAARAWGQPNAAWAAAAAVQRAAETALRVTREVVQFHGAIGFADEYDAGLYLRRAMTVGARHGAAAMAELRQGLRD